MFTRLLRFMKPSAASGIAYLAFNSVYNNLTVYADSRKGIIKRHPSDLVHGIFSSLVYEDNDEGETAAFKTELKAKKYNQYIKDWKVHKVHHDAEHGDYYGVMYVSTDDNNKHLVLAHRGTTTKASDALKRETPWNTNFKGIVSGNIVSQQVAAYKMTKEACKYAKDEKLYLSITGHSLGGWLAKLSLYWCHFDTEIKQWYKQAHKTKAVTFDSPGTKQTFEKFKPSIENDRNNRDLKILDITTYLSELNAVNSLHEHLGRVYKVTPTMPPKKWPDLEDQLKKIPKFGQELAKNRFIIDALLAVLSEGHSIDLILDTFDPVTGKPRKYEVVNDWPRIKHIDSTTDAKTKLVDFAVKIVFDDTTLINGLELLAKLYNGNVVADQYFAAFRHMNNIRNGQGIAENIKETDKDNFLLRYEGGYDLEKSSEQIDGLCRSVETDRYLETLHNIKLEDYNLLSNAAYLLRQIKSQYKIEKGHIITENISVDELRRQIQEVIDNSTNGVEQFLHDPAQYKLKPAEIVNNGLGEILGENTQQGFPSVLPSGKKCQSFVGRKAILEKIEDQFKRDNILVISAVAGSGKTSTAYKYAEQCLGNSWPVAWIDCGTEDESASALNTKNDRLAVWYNEMAKKWCKSYSDPIRSVYDKMGKSPKKFLLIFDNVESYESIKPYIENLPQNVKILITSRAPLQRLPDVDLPPLNMQEAINALIQSLRNPGISRAALQDVVKELGVEVNGEWLVLPWNLNHFVGTYEAHILKDLSVVEIARKSKPSYVFGKLSTSTKEEDQLMWKVLQYVSRLDPDYANIKLLKKILNPSADLTQDEKIDKAILELRRQKFIEVVGDKEKCIQHHRVIREEITKQIRATRQDVKAIDAELLESVYSLLSQDTNNELLKGYLLLNLQIILHNNLNNHEPQTLNWQIELYTKLASYYEAQSNQELRIKNLLTLVLKQKKCHGEVSSEVVKSLDSIGIIYSAIDNYEEAIKYTKQALDIGEKLQKQHNTNDNVENNITLSNKIADYYSKLPLPQTQQELEFRLKVLKKKQELYRGNHKDIADSLVSVARTYGKLGKDLEVLRHMETALKMRIELYKGDHIDIVTALEDIANAYLRYGETTKTNDPTKSIELLKQAYLMSVRIGGPHASISTRLKNNLASKGQAELNNKEQRELIKQHGTVNENILRIKQKIQYHILNVIHGKSTDASYWSYGRLWCLYQCERGVVGYLDSNYIKSLLGNDYNQENLSIVRMLILEAISIGIVTSGKKDFSIAIKFAEKYREEFTRVKKEHPEYLVDGSVVRALTNAGHITEQEKKQLLEANFAGKATYEHAEGLYHDYFSTYSKVGMEELLKLRLQQNNETQNDNTKIFIPDYAVDKNLGCLERLISDIKSKLTEFNQLPATLLISINYDAEHWVGMSVEFVDGKINVTYMDPEGNSMPKSLNDGLKVELAKSYPNTSIEITEKEVESQKYNNCGLEVIENLIAAVAGEAARIEQDEILEAHSILYEQHLIENALEEEKARKNTAEVKVHPTQLSQTDGGTKESMQQVVSITKVAEERQKEHIKDTNEVTITTTVSQVNSVVRVTDTTQKEAQEPPIEDVRQEAQKQDEVGGIGAVNMSFPDKPTSIPQPNVTQQSSESMEEVWRQSENKDGTELNATELKEVCLGQQELDSINVTWNHIEAQTSTTKTTLILTKASEEAGVVDRIAVKEEKPETESITIAPVSQSVVQQQQMGVKGQPSNVVSKQLPTQFDQNYAAAHKAIISMGGKVWTSIVQTVRMAMYVDTYDVQDVLHSVASTGGCAVPTRPYYSQEGREIISGLKRGNPSDTTSLSRKSSNKRLKEDDFAARFFAGNKNSGYGHFQRPTDDKVSLLEGIKLTRNVDKSWAQQFQEEVPLSGDQA